MKTAQRYRISSIYKALLLFSLAGSLATFSSCQTMGGGIKADKHTGTQAGAQVDTQQGATQDAQAGAPEWTRKTPKSAEFLFVVGYGKVADRTTSTKRAVADGKDQISKWLETKVQTILLEHTSETASSSRSSVTETALEISRSVSRASISGVVQKAFWAESDGGVWVLLEVPRAVPIRQFEEAAHTLTRRDAAAWSAQKMKEALRKLEEEL